MSLRNDLTVLKKIDREFQRASRSIQSKNTSYQVRRHIKMCQDSMAHLIHIISDEYQREK